ncbi:sensor histidine kinase [Nucisporomicrobium flavum]|uniref:sensor histidine kinase n=1 Tax=Nucisporomicrobium flavum TaxID=2785915 RepID=UPI003C2F3175
MAHPQPTAVLAGALLLIGPLALAWRRRAPLVVLAVTAAASVAYAALSEPSWTYAVAPIIALFTAVKTGRARPALAVTAAAYAAYLAVTVVFAGPLGVAADARPGPREAVLAAIILAVTMFLGGAGRARGEYLAEMTKANAERARAREEQERRQAADERLRIARELHDVLGHHLSLINVQAGVGLHLMDSRPEQAREALTAIKTASAEALREVRSVLAALRPEEEAAPRQPALGLDRLADLTADAGLPVTTATSGQQRPLPAEVDRAAYRIVQEALTNVRRHAAAQSAHVAIEYFPTELRVTIRNDGPPVSPASPASPDAAAGPGGAAPSDGSGIAGMRARAETLGGTLTAGPLAEGGYLVCAVLPTIPAAAPAGGTT